MDSQLSPTDVIVIGGGLAGLTTACYLARAGMTVTLFEKAAKLGGRAVTQNYEGFSFNRGAHALYLGGAASQVLQELGILYSGGRPKKYFALYEGKLYTYPTSPVSLLQSNLLQGADKLALIHLFASLPRLKPYTLRQISALEWLERTVQRPLVRKIVVASGHVVTYTAALDQISAEVFLTQTQRLFKYGAFYIDGGWQTLIEKLRQAAEQAGVHIINGVHVEAVLHQEGHVEGIRLRTGETMYASTIVVAAGPRDASALVGGGTHPFLRQLTDTIIPVQIASLDVALRHLPPPPHYSSILDLDQPRFLTFQSLTAAVAPQGGGMIQTFKYLDPTHPTDPQQDERDLEGLLDIAQPGWRAEVVKRIFLPRIEASHLFVTAIGGGISGRPGCEIDGIAGLYLAGDWIGAEGYLADASMASARQVVHLMLHKENASIKQNIMTHASKVS